LACSPWTAVCASAKRWQITHLGGTGIAAAVDHLDPDQVKTLAEKIRTNHGHIDVLVNNIWGAELLKGGPRQRPPNTPARH